LAVSKDYTPNLSNVVFVHCPLPAKDKPRIHHVAVGVSEYSKKEMNLNVADKDARELRQTIDAVAKGGLRYRAGESFELLNKGATRDAVLKKIDAVRTKAQPGDLFVLSFAGHGVRDGSEFFLLTHEAVLTHKADQKDAGTLKTTAISGADLRDKLGRFPCQV